MPDPAVKVEARIIVEDDGRAIRLSIYGVRGATLRGIEVSPLRALQLAAEFLQLGLRRMK